MAVANNDAVDSDKDETAENGAVMIKDSEMVSWKGAKGSEIEENEESQGSSEGQPAPGGG